VEVLAVDADAWPNSPASEAWSAEFALSGFALVCLDGETDWLKGATRRATRNLASRRVEVEITRNFLGIPGAPQRYVIL
jgi:hypothetical protein